MLLRAIACLPLLVCLSVIAACDDSGCEQDTGASGPAPPQASKLFEAQAEASGQLTQLFRDGAQLILVQSSPSGELRVEATLTSEALVRIDDSAEQLSNGEPLGAFDPQCLGFLDASSTQLWLPTSPRPIGLSYPWGCPPAALVSLDEMLRELALALPSCEPSSFIETCVVQGGL